MASNEIREYVDRVEKSTALLQEDNAYYDQQIRDLKDNAHTFIDDIATVLEGLGEYAYEEYGIQNPEDTPGFNDVSDEEANEAYEAYDRFGTESDDREEIRKWLKEAKELMRSFPF